MPHATAPTTDFQALILCGPGESLNPFNSNPDELPKALIPIANRPMVWYPLEWCHRAGITSTVSLHPDKVLTADTLTSIYRRHNHCSPSFCPCSRKRPFSEPLPYRTSQTRGPRPSRAHTYDGHGGNPSAATGPGCNYPRLHCPALRLGL
jgi:hypothetical protein